jgi:hypothetical protein
MNSQSDVAKHTDKHRTRSAKPSLNSTATCGEPTQRGNGPEATLAAVGLHELRGDREPEPDPRRGAPLTGPPP